MPDLAASAAKIGTLHVELPGLAAQVAKMGT